ncbi:MAG: ParB/RepB/Spo0J family partition protein [Lachnospiraceae bacterium]
MKSSASKIKMTSYDELFGEDTTPTITEDSIVNLPISSLFEFDNHPFKVLEDEKMEETKESIAKYGVLVPIIVRSKDDNTYEIVAGHRRKKACELLGIETIPSIIRKLDDEESTIIMVDSNIQRENLLFSEKAFAYKMKLEAIKRQGKRTDLTSTQVAQKLSVEVVADDAGTSKDQVRRYIRLTELIEPLLDMVDERKIAFNAAVELSYLPYKEQEMVLDKMEYYMLSPSLAQATKLKKYHNESGLTDVLIDSILSETAEKPVQVTFKKDKLKKYFPKEYSAEQIEDVITTLLEKWHLENN